jgi:RHS repeat-associated protein
LGGPAPYWTSWQFDAIGNRTKETAHTGTGDQTTNYAYPAPGSTAVRPHAVTGTTGARTANYTYDAAGNMLTRPAGSGTQILTWDPEGHLESATDSTGTTNYLYDTSGNRMISRDATGRTLYLPGQEIRYTAATGKTTATRYYAFGGSPIASRTAAGLTWLASDRQGTGEISIDAATQQQLTVRRQTPYGAPRGSAGAWPNNRGFVGGTLDNTGLTHLGAREYDPVIGRFISVDPKQDLTDPQQWNAYTYANNNPILFADPSGEILGSASCTGGMVGGPGACSGYEDPKFAGPPRPGPGSPWTKPSPKTFPNGTTWEPNVDGKGTDRINGVYINLTNKSTSTWLMAEALDRYKGDHPPSVPGMIDQDDNEHTLLGIKAAWQDGYLVLEGGEGRQPTYEYWSMVMTLHLWNGQLYDTPMHTIGPMIKVGGKGGCRSFSADTEVLLADGTTKKFADLEAGDEVLATDPITGEQGAREIEKVWVHDDDLYALTIDGQRLVTTEDHPFWNETDKRWEDADELDPGDLVRIPDGTVRVTGFDKADVRHARAYNLTVAGIHTYYVLAGHTPVLVHNDGGDAFTPGDIDTVEQHLSTLDPFDANDEMISRIRANMASGTPLSSSQVNFMRHETTEARLMSGGMSYEDAHSAALETHPPGQNYDVDIIKKNPAFGPWWKKQNGIGSC